MKKILYFLYQPYKYLVFIPYLALSTLFFGFLAVLAINILKPRRTSRLCGKTWARLNSYMTPMLVRVSGSENIVANQSYVIVSNHQSHYDIFVIYGWMRIDFRWVMKQELRKIPGLGIACEKIGHIYIDRSDHVRAIESISRAKKSIAGGTSVMFFPEGTRSEDGSVGPFKKGAFRMAMDLQLPILPVTILGTGNILPSHTLRLFPGRARMIIHKPIDTGAYTEVTIQELMEKTRSAILSAIPTAEPQP